MTQKYIDKDYPLQEESFKVIGICMEIHRILGRGFLEIVYKDAIEYEFKKHNIPYGREVQYEVTYKEIVLPHKFFADFVVYNNIILEVKVQNGLPDEFDHQLLNYLAVSKCKLGLLINFGHESLRFKRMIL